MESLTLMTTEELNIQTPVEKEEKFELVSINETSGLAVKKNSMDYMVSLDEEDFKCPVDIVDYLTDISEYSEEDVLEIIFYIKKAVSDFNDSLEKPEDSLSVNPEEIEFDNEYMADILREILTTYSSEEIIEFVSSVSPSFLILVFNSYNLPLAIRALREQIETREYTNSTEYQKELEKCGSFVESEKEEAKVLAKYLND